MKLEACLLVVKDMAVARRFYQDVLGCAVMLDLDDYVVFEGGFCLLTEKNWQEFLSPAFAVPAYKNNACELSFEDEDLDAFLEHLRAFPGIEVLTPLKTYDWGQRALRFYDPDGHVVEVGESMKTVVKRFLASGLSVEETMQKSMYPREFVEMCLQELKARA